MSKNSALLLLFFCCFALHLSAQRAKNGSYTVTVANTQINAYTAVTANAAVNATSITVASNTLTNGVLSTPLTQGDLIMIIQMQGATMDVDVTPTASWGGSYTVPNGHQLDWGSFQDLWGNVTSYNNAGRYELIEVRSVVGGTTINLMCGLQNAYTASGHVQVVRVPRFSNLTVNTATSVVPALWNGTIGGVVALEIDGNLTLTGTGRISASAYGFRGGVCDLQTAGSPPSAAANVGYCASNSALEGAEKGEGIGGFYTEYDALYSRYCKSAPANGGGGGGNHNAGGGGGSNIGAGAYTGKGNPTGYTAIWNLESAGFGTSTSSGGGRGGYSYSTSNQNETVIGPNNTAWSGDYRRSEGGLGGHPLTYSSTRLFMGGGGGAGDANSNPTQGGNGGRGGGIVFVTVYGAISGTGTIESNGAAGQNANPAGQTATPASSQKYGNDAAGGAGGGGAIAISNGTAIPASVTLAANGGVGGNQVISFGTFASPAMEADGPGGGGAGGQIAFTSGAPVQTVTGGANGTTNSSHVPLFPPNGATAGASGIASLPQPFFNITSLNVSICTNTSTTLTATVIGTLPGGATLTWYSTQFGNTVVGSGATFTTPVLSATTTYYVGTCPGTFRIPVVITVGAPTISGVPVITDAGCASLGSITGLTTSGGAGSNVITWNGAVSPGMNLTNAAAGNYTIIVTDLAGCTATAGPYTIGTSSGPTINTTNLVVTNANCLGNNGSITGITATGTGLTYAWTNSAATTLDITGLAAGNYTLTVTDNAGCTATSGPYTITQSAGPTLNATALVITTATCGNSNGSITGITATGTGLTYSWNGNATIGTDLLNVASGNYTLTITDNIGCTASAGPFNVPNAAGPTIDAANLVIVDEHCGSGDGSISGIVINGGTPAISYSWNGGAYNTLDISNLSAGNYTLTVTDFNGCTASVGPYTVLNLSGPSINATGILIAAESCTGNDGSIAGITASGNGLTYDWNGSATPSADLTNAAAGNYTLTVTDAFGCTATSGPHTITGATVMTLDATNVVITPSDCNVNNGAITGLVVLGGINPVISWSNGPSTADNTALASALYTITITDAQNCVITSDYTVGLMPNPVIDLVTPVNATCNLANASITINASGGTGSFHYSIDNGVLMNSGLNTFTNLSAGTYDIIVLDDAGCSATSSIIITDSPVPVINSIVTVDPTCGNTDGSITVNASGGSGALQYDLNGTGFVSGNQFNNLGAGLYTVVVQDNLGCTVQQDVTLTNQSGTAVNAGADLVVCAGESVTLNATNAQIYAWDNSVVNGVSFIPAVTTIYTVTGTDAFGCTSTDQLTVTVNTGLTISVVPSVISGCGPLTVTFQNTTPNSGDCIWQFSNGTTLSGPGDQTVTFNQSGCIDLTLSVVAINGCEGTQTFNDIVCVDPAPIASFTPSPGIMTTGDTYSTMFNSSLNATQYSWDFGDGSAGSNQTSPTHQFPDTGAGNYTVTLTATNANGCTDIAQAIITVNEELIYYVPNSFTPNNDGINDIFLPIFTSGFEADDYNLTIFNRWGEKIFDETDHLKGWDGTYAGNVVQNGVYTYRIEFKYAANDGREVVHGHVTLEK
ncbi:MAG: gliding motility-associated C-terminal domain-containing protein [Fluviicola sp.]|nr:gliding motility-associated C-terminal domain-containing protein [Fluviicola sp.]